jgi:hypothetical protein
MNCIEKSERRFQSILSRYGRALHLTRPSTSFLKIKSKAWMPGTRPGMAMAGVATPNFVMLNL